MGWYVIKRIMNVINGNSSQKEWQKVIYVPTLFLSLSFQCFFGKLALKVVEACINQRWRMPLQREQKRPSHILHTVYIVYVHGYNNTQQGGNTELGVRYQYHLLRNLE